MLARQLRRAAVDARRKAEKMDRLADRINADLAAGHPLDPNFVLKAIGFTWRAQRPAAQLTGVDQWADERDFVHAVFPPRVVQHEATPTAAPPAPIDPIAQATAIVRSASCEEIDWSLEPLTERERLIRQAYLERVMMAKDWRRAGLKLDVLQLDLICKRESPASDLQAALDEYNRRCDVDRREVDRREMRAIADEVDAQADDR
jgi:hypothetical protein